MERDLTQGKIGKSILLFFTTKQKQSFSWGHAPNDDSKSARTASSSHSPASPPT